MVAPGLCLSGGGRVVVAGSSWGIVCARSAMKPINCFPTKWLGRLQGCAGPHDTWQYCLPPTGAVRRSRAGPNDAWQNRPATTGALRERRERKLRRATWAGAGDTGRRHGS